MKKNFLLLLVVTALTLLIAIGLIRTLAPALLGGPADLRLVQLDEKQPAFFKGVFREGPARKTDITTTKNALVKDPLTRLRGRPMLPPMLAALGPHDLLGFRNPAVPVAADIVTIGDSMTYGNNASMLQNWPGNMQVSLQREDVTVYNMSIGGWAAVQYLDMLDYAQAFRPYVVVIAFYTGNDPIESFQMATGNDNWKWLMQDADVDPGITLDGLPEFTLNIPPEQQWPVTFDDGVSTVFTPQLRQISNIPHPAIDAGYTIMARAGQLIAEKAMQLDIQPVFTIIPTKELVYADKVNAAGLAVPDSYREQVSAETGRIQKLSAALQAIAGARYVDVVKPLQRAALGSDGLYPVTNNGHPVAAGYKVIGDSIAATIADMVPELPCGLYATPYDDTNTYILMLNSEGVWYFTAEAVIERNGWPAGEVPMVDQRQLLRMPQRGPVTEINPPRFGPTACQH